MQQYKATVQFLELCSPTETKENMFKVTLYVALIRGEEEIKK